MTPTVPPKTPAWQGTIGAVRRSDGMFFFFSNRLGCLGSLLVTALGTLVILFLLGWV
jgi:hypothetical protein